MGWHEIDIERPDPLFIGMDGRPRFYFAHSYHVEPSDSDVVVASADYGYSFPICVRRGALAAAQFHPEKSHRFGLRFLENFVTS